MLPKTKTIIDLKKASYSDRTRKLEWRRLIIRTLVKCNIRCYLVSGSILHCHKEDLKIIKDIINVT